MSALPFPIKDALHHHTDKAAMARIWRRVSSRRCSSGRRGRLLPYVASCAACAAGCGLVLHLLSGWREADEPPAGRHASAADEDVGPLVAPADGTLMRAFSDGSRAILSPGTSASVLVAQSSFITVVLESGVVTLDLQKSGTRHWSIDAGLATLDATKAALQVRRGPEHLAVHVERGVVWLREKGNSGTVRVVHAGGRVEIAPGPSRLECPPRQAGPLVCDCGKEPNAARGKNQNVATPSHSSSVQHPSDADSSPKRAAARSAVPAGDVADTPTFAGRFAPLGAGFETKPARVELLRDRVRLVGEVHRRRVPAILGD